MSLTGFLFGNVDEEGNLSDNELANELRDTLGDDSSSGDYLSSILGSGLFSDSIEKSKTDSEGSKAARESSTIKPAKDAIDFSDFNELADEAASAVKWNQALSQVGPVASFKYGETVERAQVDDDYDEEEDYEEDEEEEEGAGEGDSVAPAVAIEETSVGQGDYIESDEENLEDLFDSPELPDQTTINQDTIQTDSSSDVIERTPSDATEQHTPATTAQPENPPTQVVETPVAPQKTQHAVRRAPKRIMPGPIRFTDYFGCQLVRYTKKPRRVPPASAADDDENDDELLPVESQLALVRAPALDTRKLLLAPEDVYQGERPESFLRNVLARSMAGDDKTDVFVTIDGSTGIVASQKAMPKHKRDTAVELFEKMPYPLDIEDWEREVLWDEEEQPTVSVDEQQALIARPKNQMLEDFETHIIWDCDTPFQPHSQLQINLNDTNMLFEDANSIKESNAREAERQRRLEGVDQFNLSNDHYYEALQGRQTHRVRQTFGQIIVAHSLPSLRLQPPYFKMRHTRNDLRSWHRPCLQVPVNTAIQFTRVRSAKKRKQKYSMENPWAAKDVTLKDTADCVLMEYSEEYPLVMSNVGMGSVFVNYYRKRGANDQAFPKVDLGELFILDVADISPFLNFGNIEPGQVVPALYNNMFRAPLFQQTARRSDFLLVKHVTKGESKWFVRNIRHQYVVGQTYPLQEVPAPHSRKVTTTVKNRLQVAAYRLMNRNQYHLLQMAKLSRLFPEYTELQIRQRLKEFCEYQRKGLGAGYWKPKHTLPIPDEDNLRKMLTPEMLCLYESMRVCQQQLHDAGKLNEGAEDDGDDAGESKLSIEELLATWNLTRNFINATQGKAMLKLHGEGDPTGRGEGFSFVRVSMKDIFLRAGESVEEKLAEIEARPKSAHRYNVAEQQQIYKEEITSIWNKQFKTLTSQVVPQSKESQSEAYVDENVIVPEINDMFGDSAMGQDVASIDPARSSMVVPGSAIEVSQKMIRNQYTLAQQQAVTAHANLVQPNRKSLVIRRAVKSPYTGELMWRTEVVRDVAVIQAYLRQRRIIEKMAVRRDDTGVFGGDVEPHVMDIARETEEQLVRLKWAKEQREADARKHETSHMTTFSLPQPNKPKKEVIRKCGNCGQLGHMKTNKKCPRYYEFNPV
ncbi:hypothetical protein GGI07_005618 [Coemansia sp. Benny D115]|nr:hypothetical protein GGI07_005618 [Coemansia sp. Benny D115]